MTRSITSNTRLVALLGDPVAHSLSPVFQNAAFHAAGVDGIYLAVRCDADELVGLLRGIAGAGGAGNVTVPHKPLAASCLDRRAAAVERTGACNAFWSENGRVCGDNTDVSGVARALESLLGAAPLGARVLLLGAGGAAAAALAAVADGGAAEVTILNRTASRAESLAQSRAGGGVPVRVATEAMKLRNEAFDVAINATTLGVRDDDPLPLPLDAVRFTAALDLVYRPAETRWVHALRAGGAHASDGLDVLLHQGAAAFELWWRVPAPLAAMRAALPARSANGAPIPAAHAR